MMKETEIVLKLRNDNDNDEDNNYVDDIINANWGVTRMFLWGDTVTYFHVTQVRWLTPLSFLFISRLVVIRREGPTDGVPGIRTWALN